MSKIGEKGISVLEDSESRLLGVHGEDEVFTVIRDEGIENTGREGFVVVSISVIEPLFNRLMKPFIAAQAAN